MKYQDDEDTFLKKVKDSLDRSEENLDAETQSRLNRIRRETLKIKKQGESKRFKWLPVPLPALATACGVLLAIFFFSMGDHELTFDTNLEDLEILASNNKLDFYEDLDFYAWLVEQELDAG
ncbi:MAG: hypothetical protein NPINA01_03580 [Nitrospinaceae bacterium]|nr:MAG: hypothetical protein NPINA01_03580 [Nitrospinaceae bacterium]